MEAEAERGGSLDEGADSAQSMRQGTTGRSKSRASLACMQCRQRKTKCSFDPVRNSCSSCRALQVPCAISRDGDRRKVASRQHISAIQDRLRYLEEIVASRGQSSGQPDPGFDGSLNTHSNEATEEVTIVDVDLPSSEPTVERRPSHHANETLNEGPAGLGPAPGGQQTFDTATGAQSSDRVLAQQSTFALNLDRLTPPNEADSPCLNVDEESRQPRFYGPTSQRHIHVRSVPEGSDGSSPLHHPSAVVNMDSEPVRNLLLQTFWRVQPLSQALIDQDMFETGRTSLTGSKYYSHFLENSILACATRMSTSSDIRALGPRFADRASCLITQELQEANIATLQGFLLLSDYEATRGRDRLGYMYCGIGCRMVFDLGLQESCSELVARGKLPPSEALSRYLLFLGAFVYDKLWSLYLGRPSAIPSSYLTIAHRHIAEHGWQVPATLDAWVGLSANISQVTDILNSAMPLDVHSFERLYELDDRIGAQCAALPSSLVLNEDQISDLPAAAYGLHIQFRGIRIVLHRLLSKAVSHNAGTIPCPLADKIERSRTIMRENAICIARLASVYQQIFGIETFITVMLDNMFVAAALLISHILRTQQHNLTPPPDLLKDKDTRWLRCLSEMLQNAQKHYPVTTRMRSTLSAAVENTPLAGLFGSESSGLSTMQNNSHSFQLPSNASFNHNSFGHELTDQQDFFFQNTFDGNVGHMPQDMDMTNTMSWILSPMD